jgi:NAD(P)H-flavin reductase
MSSQSLQSYTMARVAQVHKETPDTYTLLLELRDGHTPAEYTPGQFNMLYLYGVGEVPISVASWRKEKLLMHTIRSAGSVTTPITRLEVGRTIGIRGPFGSPWPLTEAVGKQLLLIAGGLGLPPLRPVIEEARADPGRFNGVKVLYGARTPEDLIYRHEYAKWGASKGCEFLLTVDRGSKEWTGNVGVVTTLFRKAGIIPDQAVAFLCGPELMLKFCIIELTKMGVSPERIFVSMERNMSCGVGTCGHCQLGPLFICRDGPVFRYPRVKRYFPREGV